MQLHFCHEELTDTESDAGRESRHDIELFSINLLAACDDGIAQHSGQDITSEVFAEQSEGLAASQGTKASIRDFKHLVCHLTPVAIAVAAAIAATIALTAGASSA